MELLEISVTCPGCGTECRGIVPEVFDAGQMRCGACRRALCRFRAIKGYVYVLSNSRMPGLVKVGCSTRPVDERIAELNSATGVPVPFVVEAYFASSTPEEHEAEVHRRLAERRIKGREFFEADAMEVVRTVQAVIQARPHFQRQPSPTPPMGASSAPSGGIGTESLQPSGFRNFPVATRASVDPNADALQRAESRNILPTVSVAGSRWSCGLCKHEWPRTRQTSVSMCPLCGSTSIVPLT